MGSLAETRPTKSGREYTCKIATVLRERNADADDIRAVADAMEDESMSSRRIADWLGVSENTVAKHRRVGGCACSRG